MEHPHIREIRSYCFFERVGGVQSVSSVSIVLSTSETGRSERSNEKYRIFPRAYDSSVKSVENTVFFSYIQPASKINIIGNSVFIELNSKLTGS